MRRLITFAAVLLSSSVFGAQHFTHTKFGAILYGSTTQSSANGRWIGRHQDLLINPSAFIRDTAYAVNPNSKYLNYMTFTTIRDVDTVQMETWAAARGINKDTLILRVTGSAVQCSPPQNVGAPCPSMICFQSTTGQRLTLCQWNTVRNMPDWSKQGSWWWIAYKMDTLLASTRSDYYGPMEDEALCDYQQGNLGAVWTDRLSAPAVPWAHWPLESSWCLGNWTNFSAWSSYTTHNQVRQQMIDLHDLYLPPIMTVLRARGRKWFANAAAYGRDSAQVIQDARLYGRSLLYGEGMNINIISNGYKQTTWNTMDSIGAWGPVTGCEAAVATYIGDNKSLLVMPEATNAEKLIRQNFHNYCFYMMATNPYTYFYVHGNNSALVPPMLANDWLVADSLYKWQNVMAVDIGPPTGVRSIVVAGTFPVWRRNFQKGVILYRPADSASDKSNASAVSVSLGRTMYRINVTPDTTKQAASTTTMLRVGDGAVLVDSTYFSHSVSISNASSVAEGGQLAFVVNRNWTDAAVTIFYNTVDGTAVAPEDYVAELNGQLTIPAGFSSGTIFILTNADALLEPTQTMGVHLSSSSDGSIITADGSGSILDGTTPPSTTNEKKLKLKKE